MKGIIIFSIFHVLAFLLIWSIYKTAFTHPGGMNDVNFYIKKNYIFYKLNYITFKKIFITVQNMELRN